MDDMGEDFRPLQNVELRQLRSFVTLAEELNFRKAAQRLYITQPSLSHQIALLESTLHIRLFDRDRRRVSLTEAGKAILDDARRVLSESQAIVMKARQMTLADSATLRVGYPEFANRTMVPLILADFRSRYPDAKVLLSEAHSRMLLDDLRDGQLDVAFVTTVPGEDFADLHTEEMINEEAGLLLAANHRLAVRSEIDIEAIAKEQILLAERSINPAVYDYLVKWFRRAGLEPHFFNVGGSGVYTYDTSLRVIESGEAVGFSTESMSRSLPPAVVFRPIHGSAPHFHLAAVWDPKTSSRLLHQFLSVAQDFRDSQALSVERRPELDTA